MTDATDEAPAAEPKPKTVEVTAAKAFLGPKGWVQVGDKIDVTETRKRELARNGLIEGSAPEVSDGSTGQTSTPLGGARQQSRKLTVGGNAGGSKKTEA